MVSIRRLLVVSSASLAGLGLLATPAAAVPLPLPQGQGAPLAYDSHAEDGFGYRHHRWRHRDRINGGDVVAGILVLGAIAAIADAASDDSRREPAYRDPPARYREPARSDRSWGQGGIDNAVDICVDQVERGNDRVGSVDTATRDGSGWRVAGSTTDGTYFSCRLDNEGRVRAIDMGDGYSAGYDSGLEPALAAADGQLSDEAYARARAVTRQRGATAPVGAPSVGEGVDADLVTGPQPAYPGGPLPGEEGYEDSFGG